jgi:pilus assembly protein CpaE
MYGQLSSIIIDADVANRREMAHFLAHFGVQVLTQLPRTETLGTVLNAAAPQIVIVNLDPGAHEQLKKISHLPRQFPGISFFVMSQTLDATLLMEAMHYGVKEFIPLPIAEDKFGAAIERVASMHGMGKKAKLIHVVPTMGGCGSTTIACNVAAAMARSAKTALLDLDIVRGGVASYFDTSPRYTIADVMESAEKVDKQLLDNALVVHQKSGLAILARPEQPEEAVRITQPGIARLLNVLGRMFDYVVMDSVMSVDPTYSAVIQAADINVVVVQLNVPSAKNAERYISAMRRAGIDRSKIMVVVNRYVKKGWDIEPQEVERMLGHKLAWMVPNDFKNAIAAINYGEPVVLRSPRAEMSASLFGLADSLSSRADKLRVA